MSVAEVRIGSVVLGGAQLAIIAGPCVIENRDSSLRHAEQVRKIADREGLPIIYKSSFDKANRSSHRSFRGPGLEAGLEILSQVKRDVGIPVLTDVHEVAQVAVCAEVADVLQIPALLSRQTDLVLACARTGKAINIKKGQFLAPWDMKAVVEKAESAGANRILLTERGFVFGYNNLVSDMRSLLVMRELGYPVVFDATHSVQLPGAGGTHSLGQRQFIAPLACAAVAAGADAVFMEVHEDPDHALSDGPNSLPLDQLPALLRRLRRIREALASVE